MWGWGEEEKRQMFSPNSLMVLKIKSVYELTGLGCRERSGKWFGQSDHFMSQKLSNLEADYIRNCSGFKLIQDNLLAIKI